MNQNSVPGKYEYLPHPADLKIRGTGDTLEEAFANIILALTATRDDAALIAEKKQKNADAMQTIPISIKSRRLTSLLFDLCQKYLENLEVKRQLPIALTNAKITNTKTGFVLSAEFECIQLSDEQVDNLIKAPTYHEMNIESVGIKTQATIVLDI